MASRDERTSCWEKLAPFRFDEFTKPRSLNSESFLVVSRNGSYSGDEVYTYHCREDKWENIISYPSSFQSSGYCAALDTRHKVLYVYDDERKLYRYDISAKKLLSAFSDRKYVGAVPRMEFIDIDGTLHLVGGSNNNQHLIWNKEQSDFVSVHEFGDIENLKWHGLVYLQKTQSLLCFGGYLHGQTEDIYTIREYNVLKKEWTVLDVELPHQTESGFGIVSVRNEKYVLVIDCVIGRIFVFNVSERKFHESKVPTPFIHHHCHAVVTSSSMEHGRADLIVSGFVRSFWKTLEFQGVAFPDYLVGMISDWIPAESVHVLAIGSGDHCRISVHMILEDLEECRKPIDNDGQ